MPLSMTTAGRDKASMAGAERAVARQRRRRQSGWRRLERGEWRAAFGSGRRRLAAVAVAAGIPATAPPSHPATHPPPLVQPPAPAPREEPATSSGLETKAWRGREVSLGGWRGGGDWRLERSGARACFGSRSFCFGERWICPGVTVTTLRCVASRGVRVRVRARRVRPRVGTLVACRMMATPPPTPPCMSPSLSLRSPGASLPVDRWARIS